MGKAKSKLVSWSPSFSVGIKIVDDQHKGLIKLVNDMFSHVIGDEIAERSYFQKVIKEAVKYVKIHFATEEKIMIATKFPGYMQHKKAHDSFVLAIVANIKDYEAGKKFTLATFTRYLKEWVLTHIAVMDKGYFDYFKRIAVRGVNGRLSINSSNVR